MMIVMDAGIRLVLIVEQDCAVYDPSHQALLPPTAGVLFEAEGV
jgi:hypothetical protein